jgi:penicillin-binding protein 1A
VAIQYVLAGQHTVPDGSRLDVNHVVATPVLPASIASTETSMLETVLQYGTGRAAALGQFAAGKTGTTSNYGDAWFVGWDSKYTVAVWVGYPDKLIPMTTAFNGQPVLGGTFPALIWHDFMTSALTIDKGRAEAAGSKGKKGAGGEGEETSSSGGGETPAPPPASSGGSRSSQGGSPSTGGGGGGGSKSAAPAGGEGGGEGAAPEKSPAPAPAEASPPAGSSPPSEGSAPSSPTGGVSPGG